MGYDALAARLAERTRIGMSEELADKLKVKAEHAVRGELLAMSDDDRGALGVYLLGVYVIDDTDFWSDGEIYWWSIPTLVSKTGGVTWSASYGLPNGAPPHKCGDLEWMTNIALKDPPLLAVIPPFDEVAACTIQLGVYDDDGAVANFPAAMTAGYETLALCKPTGLVGAKSILGPVRDAIFKALKGEEDDLLLEQELTLRRDDARFGVGFIGSVATTKARVYYFVKDELRTTTLGPISVPKGETMTLRPDAPVKAGSRVAFFARGAGKKTEVTCGPFGTLTTDKPFHGEVIDASKAAQLSAGITISSNADVSVVAFCTPPG